MIRQIAGKRGEVLICFLLACLTLAVYWPVRHFDFLNFDDPAYVAANPHVFRGLSFGSVLWAFTTFHAANWHPITWLSHMLDCQLFGPQPGYHHLVNLFFHVANTLLLFGLLRQWTGAVFRSAMVAALFAWHPLHVESVAWVAERKDVLGAFFGLLAMGAYVKYAEKSEGHSSDSDGRKRLACFDKKELWYLATLALFALGLMSKAMLVTLPFILLLLDYWPLGRLRLNTGNWRLKTSLSVLWEKLPFLFLSTGASVVTALAQRSGGAMVDVEALPIGSRLTNAILSYGSYLRKMIWPTDLAVFYPYRHVVPTGEVIVALLAVVLISILVFKRFRRSPYLVVGWLWYLGMLAPVLGIVQVGAQSMADRYTYLPLIGVFVMCVWGVGDLLGSLRFRAFIAGGASIVVLVACIGSTRIQVKYWQDSETLFRRGLALFPRNNAKGHQCLGRALFDRGEYAEAMVHFKEALGLIPDSRATRLNLANCLSRQGRFEEARAHYDQAIQFHPTDAELYLARGTSLAAQLKLEEARTNFLTALHYKADLPEAHVRLGTLLMAQGKVEEASQHLATAVKIYPEYDEGHYYLAHILAEQKNFDDAALHFRAAIKANPAYAAALNDLAWMWLAEGDPQRHHLTEAISLAKRACELTHYHNAAYLETLGAALSETGRFAEAIEVTEKGIFAAAAEGSSEMATRLKKTLVAYRAGRSYSEGSGASLKR